ncbi:hypothetical protein Tco_1246247 [Tanacetum coccineum]
MHTRSQSRNLHNQQHQAPPVVEQFNLEEPIENPDPLAPMDDNRTMAQLLEAPTAGYEDAIVVPEITADNFELKHGLLNLVQNKQFFGHDKEDPHAHIRYFNKITSTMKFPLSRDLRVRLLESLKANPKVVRFTYKPVVWTVSGVRALSPQNLFRSCLVEEDMVKALLLDFKKKINRSRSYSGREAD